jgi:hypothetical protein
MKRAPVDFYDYQQQQQEHQQDVRGHWSITGNQEGAYGLIANVCMSGAQQEPGAEAASK